MATMPKVNAAVHTVAAPRLTFKSAGKAIEFYKKAFGAKEIMRFENEGGIGHAEIVIGDSVLMLAEEWPSGGRFSAETLGLIEGGEYGRAAGYVVLSVTLCLAATLAGMTTMRLVMGTSNAR